MTRRFERAALSPILKSYRSLFKAGNRICPGAWPKVSIYVGAGASYSWLWFCDLLEALGLYDLRFVDEAHIRGGLSPTRGVLFIGGGDTYEIARALGEKGAYNIEHFVREGGMYYGSCAGAYLALSAVDEPPFQPFSLFPGEMLNVMESPPVPRCLGHKYLSDYGEAKVFHAVYGEVYLVPTDALRKRDFFGAGDRIRAPVFGGPIINSFDEGDVLAEYEISRLKAAFLWDFWKAKEFIDGKHAVCGRKAGRGSVLISGPHLEHPFYPEAASVVASSMLLHAYGEDLVLSLMKEARVNVESDRGWIGSSGREVPQVRGGAKQEQSETTSSALACAAVYDLKQAVSNARIAAFGLERLPVSWKIGHKVWEPGKVRMFVDSVWRRIPGLERVCLSLEELEVIRGLAEEYERVCTLIRSLGRSVEQGEGSPEEAALLIGELKRATSAFFSMFFGVVMKGDRAS